MESTRTKIIDAALDTFVRYGARKTAMNDIADAAGVSRQTLYDLFGGKNEVIEVVIDHHTDLVINNFNQRLDPTTKLAHQLDVYFDETSIKSFELLQNSEDIEDLISGHNETGRLAFARAQEKYAKVVAALLQPYQAQIENNGQNVEEFSIFVVKSAKAFKNSTSRAELDTLLAALKTSILLICDIKN
ncbi:MAG: TetR/AcrR family transcriptional regulator [Pseudomonadota bacterium]